MSLQGANIRDANYVWQEENKNVGLPSSGLLNELGQPDKIFSFEKQTKHTNAPNLDIFLTFLTLRGYCTSYQKLACFVLYLKIINTFEQ